MEQQIESFNNTLDGTANRIILQYTRWDSKYNHRPYTNWDSK